MKVIDTVNRFISEYPTLFLKENYEESKFSVLHQCFIVNGNGEEWAYTKDPKKGGYLTGPRYRKIKGEYERIYDKPYGKEKFELDNRFWKEELYQLFPINNSLSSALGEFWSQLDFNDKEYAKYYFESDLANIPYKIVARGEKYKEGKYDYVYTSIVDERKGMMDYRRRNPYPSFDKRYSCFWHPGCEYIQDDWREAAIEHLKYWKEYFNDYNRYNAPGLDLSHYAVYEDTYKSFQEHIEKYIKKEHGEDWIKHVQSDDGYGFKDFDGTNYKELATFCFTKNLIKTREFIDETLEKLKK